MCLLVASMVHATEYAIAKANDATTIYVIDNNGSNAEYINTYVLSPKPTISELQSIGLPAHLWPILDQGNQVYDTRLIAANNSIIEHQSQIEDNDAYINTLEKDRFLLIILSFVLFIYCIGILAIGDY